MTLGLTLLAAPGVGATLPRKAADIKILMPGKPAIQLSQYKGKAVVIAFILTTCPHCQNTISLLTAMQREYEARGLQVLAAAVEGDAAKNVPGFVKQFGVNFPVGYIPEGSVWVDFMQHPLAEIPRMPMVAFIDRAGMIRTQHTASDNKFFDNQLPAMKAEIEAILGPAGGAPAKKAPAKTAPKKQS